MNALGASLLWGAGQLTAFLVLGAVVYGIARRRGPEKGAQAAACCLLIAMLVSALAMSPWPHWYTLVKAPAALDEEPRFDATATEAGNATADIPDPSGPIPAKSNETTNASPPIPRGAATDVVLTRAFWNAFWDELRQPSGAQGGRWSWLAMLATIFLFGVGAALLRLLGGIYAVGRYRRLTSAIADPGLLDLVATLSRRVGCSQPVQLRESTRLCTPATVGWRLPIVLLPASWREWSLDEQSAVIAHELSHVARSDFLTWIVARCCLACQFYHPLAHWLARRLRYEQELAADRRAAVATGGSERYVGALARVALMQDERRWSWAAQAFLTDRGMLFRRITMLRNTTKQSATVSVRTGRGLLIGVLAATGLLVAGLRGPAAEPQATTGDSIRQGSPAGTSQPLVRLQKPRLSDLFAARTARRALLSQGDAAAAELRYIPGDAFAVLAIRPARLAKNPAMLPVLTRLDEATELTKRLGIPLETIDLVEFVMLDSPRPPARGFGVVVRSNVPQNFEALVKQIAPDAVEAQSRGQVFFRSTTPGNDVGYFLPDDRTIVFDSQERLNRYIAAIAAPPPPDRSAAWQERSNGFLTAMVDVKRLQPMLKLPPGPQGSALAAFAPLWEETDTVVLGVEAGAEITLIATAQCPSAESAKQVERTAQAAITLAANSLGNLRIQAQGQPAESAARLVADLADELLKSAELTIADESPSTVRLTIASGIDTADVAAKLLPAISTARVSAQRAQDANNLKQLALAMHNFYDVHGSLPAAVVMGPDGKTPHSWRIEVLPFVDQKPLYDQYKMDEPWDSEANLKVLAQMPAVFRCPADKGTEPNSAYFVVTGATTAFPGQQASRFADITDGTSNTILFVEAKRDIPWTKPEDISFEADQKLPDLGGWFEGGFHAALCDGSVHFIAQTISEKTLRALLTRSGGEVVNFP